MAADGSWGHTGGCPCGSSTMSVPATEMSAPESGRPLTVAEPFGLAMCTSMVGADSMCRAPWAFSVALGLVREVAA